MCILDQPAPQRCAFGELGQDLLLHPECQQDLLGMSPEEQDQILAQARQRRRFANG